MESQIRWDIPGEATGNDGDEGDDDDDDDDDEEEEEEEEEALSSSAVVRVTGCVTSAMKLRRVVPEAPPVSPGMTWG